MKVCDFPVNWPGRIAPGTVSEEPVLAQDWVATMYEISNQEMAEDQAMDCTSLLSLITGKRNDEEPLHPFIVYQAGYAYDGAIREGKWVLLVDRNSEATELYNLETELVHESNLIGDTENQVIIDRLHASFLEHNDHVDETQEPRTTKVFQARN